MIKRLIKIAIVAALSAAALCAASISAGAAGERVEYYDVAAYINNYPIRCYSINNYCAVYAGDLRNYGFTVDYNEAEKRVDITRDPNVFTVNGMGEVKLPGYSAGTLYKTAGYSDIKVYLNGEETPSYWVEGSMMILLDHMYPFGSVNWDPDRWGLFLNVDGILGTEYKPLEKERHVYSRYKPGTYELDWGWYDNFPTEEVNWGFSRVEGDEPNLYSWQISMLEKFDAFYMDRSKPHKIYLTFDEGYENGYTPQILDVLSKYNVPATFFVTGQFLDESGYLVQDMIDRGFTVGNHTVNHKNLAKCSTETIMSEIDGVSNTLRDVYGYKTVYMRPPEGAISEKVLAISKDLGYNTILWSFAYYDWDPTVQKGTDYAYDMITRYMHDGAIYLLHAVSKDNANALESVIQYAIAHGYEFGSLDELCNP